MTPLSVKKLKYIVTCKNFSFNDNFIGRECLTTDMNQAVNTL